MKILEKIDRYLKEGQEIRPISQSLDKTELTEEKEPWLSMSRNDREKLRKKCKHDWRHKGTYLQGVFYQCANCGVEGKEYRTDRGSYKIKRVRK